MNPSQSPLLLTDGFDRHPAVLAWRQLQTASVIQQVQVLQLAEKSAVFRLWDSGRGSSIIAKRSAAETTLVERTIYEKVLPRLPLTALEYYGCTIAEDGSHWIFVEDAGGRRFSPEAREHRILAARWLAVLHAAAMPLADSISLPERGPDYYLEHLHSARRNILQHASNPFLARDEVRLLETILARFDLLEAHWGKLRRYGEVLPSTLVHGDFRPKNVLLRSSGHGLDLFPIDWETAGWGLAAPDLVPSRGPLAFHVDLSVYRSVVQEHLPGIDLHALPRLASVGRIFRRLAYIDWESAELCYESPDWLSRPIASLRIYQAELAEGIQSFLEGSNNHG